MNLQDAENNPHLAHAIVCEFDVSFRVQKHVVQFQISVDDPSLMQVVERQTDLRWVESEKRRTINKVEIGSQRRKKAAGRKMSTWRVPQGASFVSACGTWDRRRLRIQ